MISRIEYKFLKAVKKGGIVHDAGMQAYEQQLLEDGFIELGTLDGFRLNICRLTPKGERAINEYNRHLIASGLEIVGIVVAIVLGICGIVC